MYQELNENPRQIIDERDEIMNICQADWTVVINVGMFDVPLKEFRTKGAAEIYYYQVCPLCNKSVEMKRSDDVRYLQEVFVKDDICIEIEV